MRWQGLAADWAALPRLQRVEAFFAGHAFEPHRHATYAIGFTLTGVQSFRYRGQSEHSTAGQVFILHPDEPHDGHAGTGAGFRYRIAYVEPALIQEALGEPRCPLPFVRDAVSKNRRLTAILELALDDLDTPLEDLQRDQIILDVADALAAADPAIVSRKVSAQDWRAVSLARDLLDARVTRGVGSAELEAATGLTRYALTRHFRACLGTSPYRYLTMRRLDRVRALMRRGESLAHSAVARGFADQSHMTRHFKEAYGLSPGRWAGLVRSSSASANVGSGGRGFSRLTTAAGPLKLSEPRAGETALVGWPTEAAPKEQPPRKLSGKRTARG